MNTLTHIRTMFLPAVPRDRTTMARLVPRRGLRRAAGLTLLEALVALALLGCGIAALANLQMHWQLMEDQLRDQGEALWLAQQVLDRQRLFRDPAADARMVSGSVTTFQVELLDQSLGDDGPDATDAAPRHSSPAWTSPSSRLDPANLLTSPPDPALRRVVASIRWQDRIGEPHQLRLETLASAHEAALHGWLLRTGS